MSKSITENTELTLDIKTLVIIISFVRLITQTKGQRWFWLLLLVPALYLLLQTQSRSSLFGFAIAGILLVYLKGMNWRFIFVGPVAAHIIWLSGFQGWPSLKKS